MQGRPCRSGVGEGGSDGYRLQVMAIKAPPHPPLLSPSPVWLTASCLPPPLSTPLLAHRLQGGIAGMLPSGSTSATSPPLSPPLPSPPSPSAPSGRERLVPGRMRLSVMGEPYRRPQWLTNWRGGDGGDDDNTASGRCPLRGRDRGNDGDTVVCWPLGGRGSAVTTASDSRPPGRLSVRPLSSTGCPASCRSAGTRS